MNSAWLFPGQDAFEPALLGQLDGSPYGRRLLEWVSLATGVDVASPVQRRRAGTWTTALVQPVLAASCLARVAARGGLPHAVAGASLGALLAWAAAGQYPAEDVIRLAAVRGRLMAEAAALHPGGMIVVADAEVPAALERGRRVGVLDVAARNAPHERLLSGDQAALRAVGAVGRPVQVVGPWHSQRMLAAEPAWTEALGALPPRELACSMVHDGEEVDDPTARQLLARLSTTVEWYATLRKLEAMGTTDWYTVPPGRVLRAQIRAAVGQTAEELT